MSLRKIQSGPIKGAQKVVIYGPEGIGKSTLASLFPRPVFLDCEGGTKQLNVDRVEVVTMSDINLTCAEIQASDYKTLVIDTADWAEATMIQDILRRDNMNSLEDYGWGKGYGAAQNEFAKLLSRLSTIVNSGIHVVVLAHAQIVKFEQPDQAQPYDKWQLKLTKKTVPLLKEWADMILFLTWEVRVAVDEKTKRSRAVGGKTRILHTEHSATFDAKNRHGLPTQIKLVTGATELPAELSAAIAIDEATVKKPAAKQAPPAPPAAPDNKPADKPAAAETVTTSAPGNNLHEQFADATSEIPSDDINRFMLAKSEIQEGQTWKDASEAYLTRVIRHAAAFCQAVKTHTKESSNGKAA